MVLAEKHTATAKMVIPITTRAGMDRIFLDLPLVALLVYYHPSLIRFGRTKMSMRGLNSRLKDSSFLTTFFVRQKSTRATRQTNFGTTKNFR